MLTLPHMRKIFPWLVLSIGLGFGLSGFLASQIFRSAGEPAVFPHEVPDSGAFVESLPEVEEATSLAPEPPPSQPSRKAVKSKPNMSESAQRALAWIDGRRTDPQPTGNGAARWIDSYEDETDAGWIYDAALTVMLYTHLDRKESAAEILRGLEILQSSEGSWHFSYDPVQARPFRNAPLYVGSMAWVVVAVNRYERATGDDQFASMARKGLEYILKFRDDNPSSETFGAFSMGPPKPKAFSVENNLAVYIALTGREFLDHGAGTSQAAALIPRFIFDTIWCDTGNSSMPGDGFFQVGFRDNVLFLDAQTWTLLTFWNKVSDERRHKMQLGLDTALSRLQVVGKLEDIEEIQGFNESADSSISSKVWSEGSEGMVMALRVTGQREKANFFHEQTARYQTAAGGIPYATENSDAWKTEASVAGTVWYLFNELESLRPLSIEH